MTSKSKQYAKRTATAALAAVMLFGSAAPAFAQTSSADLQAQINALLAQIAALQGANASASVTFTRDLTNGSSGADVTALQNWLISRGFTISAGATGYFGPQTVAALARFQAANGIAPAAGYFGPVTRAKVNAMAGTPSNPTTPTTPTNPSDALEGGEADLTDYDLRREEASGNEGEEDVEIATATFDVDGGDVRVERIDLYVEATNGSLNKQPWRYFDRMSVLVDGREIADKDTDARSDWSKSGNGYRLSITGLSYVVREGDTAELTIATDINDSIDSDDLAQSFTFRIDDRGIRAVDAEGIQQYVGDDTDTVSFGFGEQENGDLRVSTNRDNPDSSILVADENRESDEYEVFVFDLQNRDDVDSLITELTIRVNDLANGVLASDVIRRATLEVGRESFDGDIDASSITFEDMDLALDGDDEVTASLMVRLARNATSTPISFSLASADIEAEGEESGDEASVSGSASSEDHAIAFAGIDVDAVSTAQSSVSPSSDVSASFGTYTIKFAVTALEEDAYIATTTSNAGTPGVRYEIGANTFTGTQDASITSSARQENGYFLIREGRTETFTLTVVLDPSAAGIFDVRLAEISFNDEASASGTTSYALPSSSGYRTNPIYIAN